MATAALTNSELRITTLAEVSPAGIDLLLTEQSEEWLKLLHWDYSGPSRLISNAVWNGELAGFVAAAGKSTVGFAFYVVEGSRCSVGDIYLSRRWRDLRIDRRLADAVLEELDRMPRVRRIESQCISVGSDAAFDAFRSRGFQVHVRHYMTANIRSEPDADAATAIEGILIRPWQDEDFARAAAVIHKSYGGQSDSLINSQYKNEEGCGELLSIIIEHLWCGHFMPRVSRVAVNKKSGKQVGVLLASRIGKASGHISQISILPAYQGQGLGRIMIRRAMAEYKRRGFETVSLAVTGDNVRAVGLYESCGFRMVHSFPVFYLDK